MFYLPLPVASASEIAFAYVRSWIHQASSNNLSSFFLRGAPLKGNVIHELPVLQSRYSRR